MMLIYPYRCWADVVVYAESYVYWLLMQVNGILQQSCVGVAMEGVNLGRNGQLCWVQVWTAVFLLYQTSCLLTSFCHFPMLYGCLLCLHIVHVILSYYLLRIYLITNYLVIHSLCHFLFLFLFEVHIILSFIVHLFALCSSWLF